jgi:arylsulfatase A-like enzyme
MTPFADAPTGSPTWGWLRFRPFIRPSLLLLLALVGVGLVPGANSAGAAPASSRPNIVFILADDLGYGDLGVFNPQSKIPTPVLDRLAGEGMRFTDAHAPSAVCTPTRYAMLTGRYAWRSRLSRGVLPPWGAPLIEPGRPTVGSLLQAQGYRTACIGKWHLGWNWPTRDGAPPSSASNRLSNVDFSRPVTDGPITRGFDYYFGVDLPNFPPYCYLENDRTVGMPSVPNTPVFNRPGPMLPWWDWVNILPDVTRSAVRYIEDAARDEARRPFFLYLPLPSPHFPVVPAPEFKGKSGAGEYGDFVHQTDWTVGRVIEALKRTGAAENTLVVFTSDNGPEVAEIHPGAYQRAQEVGHFSAGGFRGAKRDAWEGGHRVPFIAWWPGKIPAGTVRAETISHVDFLATVADLLRVPVPENAGEDSASLLPLLLGQKPERPAHEAYVHHSGNGKLAIRQGDWVLIDAANVDENGKNGEPGWLKTARGYKPHAFPGELYNLAVDPSQANNLYGQYPERVTALKELLERYKREGRSVPRNVGSGAAP